MYEAFYQFSGQPFQLSPDPRFYFASQSHRKAMAYLVYGLNQGEGFVVVTGDIGTGKTTLLGRLITGLDTKKYLAGTVVTSQLDPTDMLRMVATTFGIAIKDDDKATLLRKIEQFLVTTQQSGRQCLLIVDEVQNVPVKSLEELRMLSNLQFKNRSLLQTLLVGQPQFRSTIARPELEQLRQRVTASYHLGPLDAQDTRRYIEHRLKLVGWQGDPEITDDAHEQIFEHTGGLPRRINTLCSRLLLFGSLDSLHRLDGETVLHVVEELSQEVAEEASTRGANGAQAQAPGDAPVQALNGALADRLAVLERYVFAHEQTIQRALQLFAEYLAARGAAPMPPGQPPAEEGGSNRDDEAR
ncbi:MAG: ATPase [Alphaproteobacteria bacterium]|nr:MAG: ATPase [Alphaproteobacteria bacterium]